MKYADMSVWLVVAYDALTGSPIGLTHIIACDRQQARRWGPSLLAWNTGVTASLYSVHVKGSPKYRAIMGEAAK